MLPSPQSHTHAHTTHKEQNKWSDTNDTSPLSVGYWWKVLAIAKGILDTSIQTNTYVRTSATCATITQHRLNPLSNPQCVKGIKLTCEYVCTCVRACMAPVGADKGGLWEAETEALDNGKAYLIDGPTRNSEYATHTHAQTPFTKWRPCRNSTVIGNNYDPWAATFQWQRLSRVSGPWSSRAKSFYCSKINIQLVKIWAPRWRTWA